MGAEKVAFYILSALSLGGGLAILFSVKLMRAVIYLLVSLFGVAGLYILMNAEFLAALQVLIYIGGITVLLVFGLMLTGPGQFHNPVENRLKALSAGLSGLIATVVLLIIVHKTPWPVSAAAQESLAEMSRQGTTAAIGTLLLKDNVFAFEIASVLLLVVLIGVALFIRLARPEKSGRVK